MKRHALFILSLLSVESSFACSDIFVNQSGYHVQARTMDFPLNVSVHNSAGFIGQKNITDPVLDADKIPSQQLTAWTNRYGFFGRTAFNTSKIVDGMNTEGFSIAMLYLPGTEYPVFDPNVKQPALAIYDVGSYLLGNAKNVAEALTLVQQHQIVQSAIEAKSGFFMKDIPIHFVLRDKSGDSAVIEFIHHKTTIYPHAGPVMTNQPTYDWQVKHAKLYSSLTPESPKINPAFSKLVFDYDVIKKASSHGSEYLLGLPGDYTSASRFVRATMLLKNIAPPHSSEEATFHAQSVLNSVIEPPLSDSFTIWTIIKDLDNQLVYIKDLGYFQGGKRFYPMSVTNGYTLFDMKAIDFNSVPDDFVNSTIQPTSPNAIKELVSSNTVPGF